MEGPFQPNDVNVRCVDKAVTSYLLRWVLAKRRTEIALTARLA